MPYMLADIGRMFNPTLNIIDGLIAQAGGEWSATGQEVPRVVNTLIAGDHPITTDAVGAHLMGLDPTADWLTEPFHRDRNPLLVACGRWLRHGQPGRDRLGFRSRTATGRHLLRCDDR